MHEYNINYVPVVEKGVPIGVVSKVDMLHKSVEHYTYDAEILDYITGIL